MQSFQNGAPSDNTGQIRRLHPVVMPGNGAVSDRGAVVFAVRDAGPGRLYCRLAGERRHCNGTNGKTGHIMSFGAAVAGSHARRKSGI